MICRKCGKSIPDSANKCPYCYTRTANGWKNEGKKLIKPVTDLLKKDPWKKK
ncbi:MAG: zinc-ribbon domain-containing protein [Solobacterium sp.]|nr:zinc-ribbon domain-containing protein [Solobacterium sp.]MBQ6223188.1 zinc-ribbon domain-containing protein [Solobacterium sp.]MBR2668439.1 zinc-ribbon domain-containing protein [Solobacterium sp.]